MNAKIVCCCGFALFAVTAIAAAPFEGHYRADGKDAKLNFVTAAKDEPFFGTPVTLIVFSEKEAPKGDDKHLDMYAQSGKLGDAIAVKLMKEKDEWSVIGTELAHSASKHSGASASGIIDVKDVSVANGEISGHFMTRPKEDVFGEPIDVDLKFHVKQP
jgi:hypothetical protein